jgi:hypothetical protein
LSNASNGLSGGSGSSANTCEAGAAQMAAQQHLRIGQQRGEAVVILLRAGDDVEALGRQ